MKSILTLITTIFIFSCSSEGNNANSSSTVELLGDWNYTLSIDNTACNGITAHGIVTITSLNGDLSQVGSFLVQGEYLEMSNDTTCLITTINVDDTKWEGRPSAQTLDQYLNFAKQDEAGDSLVKSVTIDEFNNTQIVQKTELIDGTMVTSSLVR